MNNFGGMINGNVLAQQQVPQWQQPMMQQVPQYSWATRSAMPSQNNSSITWVNGWAGAQGYIIKPNTTVLLMDSERDVFYLKTANEQGMATIRSFKFEELMNNMPSTDSLDKKLENYVQKEELQKMFAEFSDNIMNSLNAVTNITTGSSPKYIEKKEG